jgi:hypothetical protein
MRHDAAKQHIQDSPESNNAMKTSCGRARLGRQIGASLAVLCVGTAFAADPQPAPAATDAPKTHVLFMGADIAVENEKNFHPVEDVTASGILIKQGKKMAKVPLNDRVNLLITESLKISDESVGIENLQAERAYTFGADPFRQMVNAEGMATGANFAADMAQGNMLRADMATAVAGASAAAAAGTQGAGAANQAFAQAQAAQAQAAAAVNQAFANQSGNAFDVSAHANRANVAAGERMYDAIRLSFHVQTDKNLPKAYFAVIAEISEPGSKPGHVRQWAHVRSMDPLSAGESRKIIIYEGGLPPGYTLGNCEVHIYNQGTELATTLSSKQVPLTTEEAREFQVIEYVSANKGLTLPASPVTATLGTDVRAALRSASFDEGYVLVAKDGRVTAAYRDEAATRSMEDPEFESLLKSLRFNPALEAGKPVESLVKIDPRQIAAL